MARLREVSYVLRKMGPVGFVRKIVHEINDDGVMNMAAAVAFYWLLALFPFFIFLLTVLPLMSASVQKRTTDSVNDWTKLNLAPQAAKTVSDNFETMLKEPRAGLLSFGILATLWAASNGMSATMTALDKCYDVERPRPYVLQKTVSIAITLAVVVALLAIMILIPVGSLLIHLLKHNAIVRHVPDWLHGSTIAVINVFRYSVGVFLVILIVSSIYQFGVSVRRRWTLVTPGAVFSVLGVIALGWGFNQYMQRFGDASYAKTYGALGGVIVLLLIFYFYAVIFLIGAEINSEIDYEVVGYKNDEAKDPLPRLYLTEDLDKFRKQLELRQGRMGSPRRDGGTE